MVGNKRQIEPMPRMLGRLAFIIASGLSSRRPVGAEMHEISKLCAPMRAGFSVISPGQGAGDVDDSDGVERIVRPAESFVHEDFLSTVCRRVEMAKFDLIEELIL
ncbi:hypothetical protein [Roseicella sp. DB1501]|uniref:hypothetical protein n=1 Tax=Roseicella sp. DB1501 TaxID=2730925 RepID=UPI00149188BD|nr:hypothetical protein [Roseicella sp. DB1501]NOG70207.1 hypothetical protein [Roseicella sp. DB1501]